MKMQTKTLLAGVAALVRSRYPNLSAAEVVMTKTRMRRSAGSFQTGSPCTAALKFSQISKPGVGPGRPGTGPPSR